MMKRLPLLVLFVGLFSRSILAGESEVLQSRTGPFRLEKQVCGLNVPWSLAFLPDGQLLVSERPGNLRLVSRTGNSFTVSPPLEGVPKVHARGQGGLLDIVLSPRFADDKTLFFSYAEPTPNGARTAVARAVLDLRNQRLTDVRVIFAQQDELPGHLHWGSRLVFGRDGRLFITLGERFHRRDQAQNLGSHLGKVVRIEPDGGIPADNPFRGRTGAKPEIWSYGHRNVQGAALHPRTGELWTHEHGPQGGDEVNRDLPGRNYGWPVITYGKEYGSGKDIGEGATRADVEPPLWYWVPSIAPSGMTFYTGGAFPRWQGNLFVGALRGELSRLELQGDKIVREERLLTGKGMRIRDVRQGPEGGLWLLEEIEGCILSLQPEAGKKQG
ncbi:MAG: PQQ-dependent sugar dehydrogenase [Zoogloeaceae bacterium]|nr:PQQ-dependent sugar dehydrogenase [Zoogloeaceae bacterium]